MRKLLLMVLLCLPVVIDQSYPVLVSSSSDGIGWTNSTSVNQYSRHTPSLAAVGIF